MAFHICKNLALILKGFLARKSCKTRVSAAMRVAVRRSVFAMLRRDAREGEREERPHQRKKHRDQRPEHRKENPAVPQRLARAPDAPQRECGQQHMDHGEDVNFGWHQTAFSGERAMRPCNYALGIQK